MITKETLAKLSREEVGKLLHKKQIDCKTCAEEFEMICFDSEYQMIKERLSEFGKIEVIKKGV